MPRRGKGGSSLSSRPHRPTRSYCGGLTSTPTIWQTPVVHARLVAGPTASTRRQVLAYAHTLATHAYRDSCTYPRREHESEGKKARKRARGREKVCVCVGGRYILSYRQTDRPRERYTQSCRQTDRPRERILGSMAMLMTRSPCVRTGVNAGHEPTGNRHCHRGAWPPRTADLHLGNQFRAGERKRPAGLGVAVRTGTPQGSR